jgi:hypothetical protein
MSNLSNEVVSRINGTPNGKNIGHDFASNKFNNNKLARNLLNLCPTFVETAPDELVADLRAGMTLSYADNHSEISATYGLIDSNYIKLEGDKIKAFKGEKVAMSVAFVMADSQQAFGALKAKNPALHALMLPIRRSVQTYVSNSMKALKDECVKVLNEGKVILRKPTKSFAVTVEDTFADMRKKCVNAKARGDDTADEKRFAEAKVAFMTKWLHG